MDPRSESRFPVLPRTMLTMSPTCLASSRLALLLLALSPPLVAGTLSIEIENHPPRCDGELTFGGDAVNDAGTTTASVPDKALVPRTTGAAPRR